MEIVDFSKIGVFVFWVIIPVFILAKSYLAKHFFTSVEFAYLIISILVITAYEGVAFGFTYLAILVIYIFWWSAAFKKYKEENPGQYEEYKKYFSEYYGDDLNQDGIKDAFENWEIAHDPRFFWLFGSRAAKRERKLKLERDMFYARTGGFNAEERNTRGYHGDRDKDYSQGAGSGFTKGSAQSRNNTYRTTSSSNNYQQPKEEYMSEAEKKVAAQHAFAKKYNLRYFAMCETKADAKKLYRKYAAKFHPDNAVTGDKEKFIAVDEEYNRFCQITEIS